MIQSDPIVEFDSRSWIPLDPSIIFGIESLIPPGLMIELMVSDLGYQEIVDPMDPFHRSGRFNYAISE